MDEKKTLTIQRSRWYRGEGGTYSALLRSEDHKMCALGWLALDCGFKEEDILNVTHPHHLEDGVFPEQLFEDNSGENSSAATAIMMCNDTGKIDDETRERNLIKLFKERLNIDLTFQD